ncbi:hypothetical protein [Candidatus Methanoliparum sp. LAM-1]|nr:hypothetical protein [Candidatus Methanoliparum sp. LAM-1]
MLLSKKNRISILNKRVVIFRWFLYNRPVNNVPPREIAKIPKSINPSLKE